MWSNKKWTNWLFNTILYETSSCTTVIYAMTLIEAKWRIYVSKLTNMGSDNGLSQCWDIMFFIGPLGTNFSEILFEIHTFSFKKMHLKFVFGKMAAILFRPQCIKIRECKPILLPNYPTYMNLYIHNGLSYDKSYLVSSYNHLKQNANPAAELPCYH